MEGIGAVLSSPRMVAVILGLIAIGFIWFMLKRRSKGG